MTLPAVGHGTRDPDGTATVRALLERVRVLRPGPTVAESYAEIAEPSPEDALRGIAEPVVAVPLMLGRGYHSLVDIPGRIGRHARAARTAAAPSSPRRAKASPPGRRAGPGSG